VSPTDASVHAWAHAWEGGTLCCILYTFVNADPAPRVPDKGGQALRRRAASSRVPLNGELSGTFQSRAGPDQRQRERFARGERVSADEWRLRDVTSALHRAKRRVKVGKHRPARKAK